jgi:putative MFS transporter
MAVAHEVVEEAISINDDTVSPLSVSDVVDHCGFGPFQWYVMMICGLISVADGAEMLILSVATESLPGSWKVTADMKGLLGSSIFTGFFIGSLAFGWMADVYGRAYMVKVLTIFITVCGTLSAFAPNFWFLLATRAVLGLGIGGIIPAWSALYIEYVPTHLRGVNIILVQIFFAVGEIFAAILSW